MLSGGAKGGQDCVDLRLVEMGPLVSGGLPNTMKSRVPSRIGNPRVAGSIPAPGTIPPASC